MTVQQRFDIERNVAAPTWFGIGGGVDVLVQLRSEAELLEVLRTKDAIAGTANPIVRVLGDGANLLIDDAGADGLTLSLARMDAVQWPKVGDEPVVIAQAGANLPKLLVEAVRRGLGGVEGLAGVPASIGGAVRMNAGGAYGEIGDATARIRVVDHDGAVRTLERDAIGLGYRTSDLHGLIVVEAELRLSWGDPAALRTRLKEVMAAKKTSQPMAERSAGCAFKNPTVNGARVSAGMLIDKAGCKGMAVGGASVSDIHANFLVVDRSCATAADVLGLMARVQTRVLDVHGVALEREVVVWKRGEV